MLHYCLRKRILVLGGVDMSRLDNFKPKKLVIGSPFLTVADSGVSFNKSALDKLEYAEFVKLLINEEAHMVALQVCDASDPEATAFVKGKKNNVPNVRWNYHDFVEQLKRWKPETLNDVGAFKVPGEYLIDEKALLFDFKEAIKAS